MTRSRVVAVIQARMGSSRLPGKVLLDVGGKTVIERVVERAARIPGVDKVLVAVPTGKADAPLRDALTAKGISFFAGSEEDVLDRFYRAAKAEHADIVLRVTADCPLLDPAVSGQVLKALLQAGADYASNFSPMTFPDGLDTEAIRVRALAEAWRRARSRLEREHVTPYIRNHPERFKAIHIANPRDLSALRWTLDEPADLEFLRALYGELNGRASVADLAEILAILDKRPDIAKLNARIKPNEGYYLSLLKEKPRKARKLKLIKSLAWAKRAEAVIPGLSQTFSKAPSQFVRGVAPLCLERGRGCRVWDVDGNEFIDTTMALAPVSLGYCDPEVDAAVAAQMKSGTILSQPHPLEVEVAETLKRLIPCAEMSRFAKNGSDATAAAVRLARYATGRDIVAAGGYHGWQDWYIGTTTRAGGVPKAVSALTKTFSYNKLDTLQAIFDENKGRVAAVILEPIGIEEPQPGFLEEVATLTRREGALLIFDEIVTGFRVGLGGAQAHYGVIPDLACFGKAMANGFPLSAVVGRADLMRRFDEIFFSGTFGGELLSLAACKATIGVMEKKPVIAHLWNMGRRLQDGYNTLAKAVGLGDHTSCVGLPVHTVIPYKNEAGEPWWELKSLVQQEAVRRGLLFMATHNPCWALRDADVDEVLRVYAAALPIAADAVRRGKVKDILEGPPVEAIFRKP